MSLTLKIIAILIVFVMALTGGAIARNKVPLTESPGLAKRLAIYLTRNTVQTRADHELPELRTRSYDLPVDRVYELTESAVRDAGWRVTDRNEESRELAAVVATPWLRFKDDVRISLAEGARGGTEVKVESRSRVGRADYGANTAHVMELYRRLDALARRETHPG